MNRITIRCTVTGRVQGVFYRASSVERAAELGIDGWVRNLDDGSVELVAAAAPAEIEALVAWLWQGPSGARVSAVSVEEWSGPVEPGFEVVR